jgi:hypothetical protein
MAPTVALVSPCGYGNLGDAAIQDAVIANIRIRHPDAKILGVTLNPSDTENRHGIKTFPIAAGARINYARAYQLGTTAAANGTTLAPAVRLRSRTLTRLARHLGSMARLVLPNRLRSALRTLGEEGRHCFQAFQ